MNKGMCFGVSLGPGDPWLITFMAAKTIEQADVIFLPSAPKENCKVYKIIQDAISEGLIKDISDDKFVCIDTKPMADPKTQGDRYDILAKNVAKLLDEGKNVAFPALGEASLYSTYFYVHERLIERGYRLKVLSGISSVQEICDRLSIALAKGDEQVHIYPDTNELNERLKANGTKIFMKPKSDLAQTVRHIQEYIVRNPDTKAYGISNCGLENEIIAFNKDELDKLSGYMSVLIVK